MSLAEYFIKCCFDGDTKVFRVARKADYCKIQLIWTCFIDGLCKDGEITQEQFNKASFPKNI